ncbi:MAG: phosphatase PAP2 family protein [Alphaproteobacteria bacterium]|nr:phosphatase PAP2 family protein [Alphaproteobacteria bacterium]
MALLVAAAELLGEPAAMLVLAVVVGLGLARGDRARAAGYLAGVAVGVLSLVLLRLAAKMGWFEPVAGAYFPSGHVGVTTLVLGLTLLLAVDRRSRGRLASVVVALVVLVATGRAAGAAHPPVDVVAGVAVALMVIFGVKRMGPPVDPGPGVAWSLTALTIAYLAAIVVARQYLPAAGRMMRDWS